MNVHYTQSMIWEKNPTCFIKYTVLQTQTTQNENPVQMSYSNDCS